ncbi:hypothetical protein V2J09_002339 [Rumex salicifolius]
MFEGVHDQFHQFLAAAAPQPAAASLSYLPISFSLLQGSISPSPFPLSFENYSSPPLQPPTHNHHHHHHQMMQQPMELQYPEAAQMKSAGSVKQQVQNTSWFLSKSLDEDMPHPWSHDELLALFRVRSAMENCFHDFTWEYVSRKLEEIGFRRSPQKCMEKFEEESRSYIQTATTNTTSTINADGVISCPTKNYRLFSELEELYHHGCEDRNDVVLDENDGSEATNYHQQIGLAEIEEETEIEEKKGKTSHHHGEVNNKKKKKLKIFKSVCENIVNKMMAHQEELHNKILEDLIRRDKEKTAREEARKKEEMERIDKETEARAKDQAMIGDRQTKIIEFLQKFISHSNNNSSTNTMIINNNNDDEFNLPTLSTHQNPSSSATHSTSPNCHIPTSSNDESLSQTSNSLTTHIDPIAPTSKNNKILPNSQKARPNKKPYHDIDNHDDIGKRWPREEVIALINIRCNLDSTNNTRSDIDRDLSNKNPPLWERISKSMMELGYNRSAKRCKEKWENINKYFRKTKDSKKKRPVDSRTCPYFHQLSHLYNIGRTNGGSGLSDTGGGGVATSNGSDQDELNGIHREF